LTLQTGEGQAINFDTVRGIVLGSKSDVITTIEVKCSNATVTDMSAFTLQMNLEANVNATIFAFVAWPNIEDVSVANAHLTQDNIGMYSHDYNILFTSILRNFANQINMQYSKSGYPLANIDPTFGLLSGLLQDFTVSPYFFNDYLLMGFSMQADKPTLTTQDVLQFLNK
jgi:hypothetical protein